METLQKPTFCRSEHEAVGVRVADPIGELSRSAQAIGRFVLPPPAGESIRAGQVKLAEHFGISEGEWCRRRDIGWLSLMPEVNSGGNLL